MNLIRPRDLTKRVLREDDGTLSGLTVEHWDGRVDARVLRPQTIRIAVSPSELDLLRKLKLAGGRHG